MNPKEPLNDLKKVIEAITGLYIDEDAPKTMFELSQRMQAHVPTKEELEEFKKNKKEMKQWEFYHWYWNLGDEEYKVGDIVTRDGTDEHVIKDIDYDYMLVGVECTKEPRAEDGEPWTKLGEYESNLIRRYSLV